MITKRSPKPLLLPRLRSTAFLFLFSLFLAVPLAAQPTDEASDTTGVAHDSAAIRTPWIYFGAYAGLSLITYDATLSPSTLTTVSPPPPAPATFRSGDGSGFLVGLLVEFPLGESFNIGARIGFQSHHGTLTQIYENSDPAQIHGAASAQVQGTVETSFGHVALTPYARIAPFSFPLYVIVGPTVLFPSKASYTYIERIGGNTTAKFNSPPNSLSRSLANKDFSNAGLVTGITAGIGYEHPLSEKLGLFGEFQFQPLLADYIGPLSGGQTFSGSALNIVVGLRFGAIKSPPPPAPPPRVPKDTTVVHKPAGGTFDAKALTSGGLADTITVHKKKVQATEVHALLPYIFFERDSAIIPPRYVHIDPKSRKDFQVERLKRGSTIDLYYQLLNIVGQRIRDDRIPEVTLTGCVSQLEKDSTLALRRAEAVRDYLTTVWKIPLKRLHVVARGIPANPSLSEVDVAEAERENQRVEISSEGYVAERPVELPDTTFLAPIGTIRFLPPPAKVADTSEEVDGWSLDVRIGDSLIKKAVTGSGAPPRQIDFPIENRPDLDLRVPLEVSSTLTIRDTLYQDMARLTSQKVVLRSEGEYETERDTVDGRYVDTYTLLLFSFDSAEATTFSQQGRDLIRPNVDSTSIVHIVGHTDRIGLPYYNKALSLRRGEFAKQLLELKATEVDVTGVGEKDLLYDNKFPEGRYYSRTVTVEVETPIPGYQSQSKPKRNKKPAKKEPVPEPEPETPTPQSPGK